MNTTDGNESSGIRCARNRARSDEGLKPNVACKTIRRGNPERSLKLMPVLGLKQEAPGGLRALLLEPL